jgi:hypothetical protein
MDFPAGSRRGGSDVLEDRFTANCLGPVNTCFGSRCCTKKREGKARSAGRAGLWPSFATLHPRFSSSTQRNGTEFHTAHRYSPLTELTLLRGSRLVPTEIRHVAGAKQVLTDPSLTRRHILERTGPYPAFLILSLLSFFP